MFSIGMVARFRRYGSSLMGGCGCVQAFKEGPPHVRQKRSAEEVHKITPVTKHVWRHEGPSEVGPAVVGKAEDMG